MHTACASHMRPSRAARTPHAPRRIAATASLTSQRGIEPVYHGAPVVGFPDGPPTAADQGALELQCSARHVLRGSSAVIEFRHLDKALLLLIPQQFNAKL
jgi:hypothetical protein